MEELEGSLDPERIWHNCFCQWVELTCLGDGKLSNSGTEFWQRSNMGGPDNWVNLNSGAAGGSRHGRRGHILVARRFGNFWRLQKL
jgi:hypothetical protein